MQLHRSPHRRPAVLALGLATAAIGLSAPAYADPAPSGEGATLTSGSTGVLSEWDVYNYSSIVENTCDGPNPGLSISDATYDVNGAVRGDAFDYGLTFWVDGSHLAAPETWDVETGALGEETVNRAVTAAGIDAGELDATVEYRAQTGSQTLRTILWLDNPTEEAVESTVTLATNVGADSGNGVRASSSGDTALTDADRWVVTSDGYPSDPVNTHVLAGPGAIDAAPTASSLQTFDCADTDGVETDFTVTVPAGGTRGLMFVNELSGTHEQAVADAARFSTDLSATELFAGLSAEEQDLIANWGEVVDPVDEGDDVAPTSSASFPALTNDPNLDLAYEATDDDSGVATVDLYVREPHAESFELVDSDDAGTGHLSYEAPGTGRYAFYTVATDVEGNVEEAPESADVVTKVDLNAPVVNSRMGAPVVYTPADGPLELAMRVRGYAETAFVVKQQQTVVRSLPLGFTEPGVLTEHWYGRDAEGVKVPAGRYSIVMKATDRAGNQTRVRVAMRVVR